MTANFDAKATGDAVVAAIEKLSKQGWQKISAMVAQQSKMMAQQAAWIAESSVEGALKNDPALQSLFEDQLADSVKGLAKDVAALTVLTVEEVWNAVVKIIWGALNKALSAASAGLLVLPAL